MQQPLKRLDRLKLYYQLLRCKTRKSKTSRGCKNPSRLYLTRSDNRQFFSILDQIGFFDFQISNKGDMVGFSQVVAFLMCGGYVAYTYYHFTSHKDELEVHHINGDVTDNRPCNLVYLSRQDHQYVSNCTYTPFYGKVTYECSTPFNRGGRPIKNPPHFLSNIIRATVSSISIKHTGKKSDLAFSKILKALPKRLWQFAVNYYQAPRWLTSQLLHSLDQNYMGFKPCPLGHQGGCHL